MTAFWVDGMPGVAGNKTPFAVQGRDGRQHLVVREGRTAQAARAAAFWRATVALTARVAYHGPPLDEPLRLAVIFARPRPQAHFRAGGLLTRRASAWPAIRPDTSKHLRALEDSLTGILWRDDALVVEHQLAKVWHPRPGAAVAVGTMATSTRDAVWQAAVALALAAHSEADARPERLEP